MATKLARLAESLRAADSQLAVSKLVEAILQDVTEVPPGDQAALNKVVSDYASAKQDLVTAVFAVWTAPPEAAAETPPQESPSYEVGVPSGGEEPHRRGSRR